MGKDGISKGRGLCPHHFFSANAGVEVSSVLMLLGVAVVGIHIGMRSLAGGLSAESVCATTRLMLGES